MRVFAFHLLNDYSGSPKVLMQLASGWTSSGLEVHMVTSAGREGFLSGLPGVEYHFFKYTYQPNPLLRLLMLSFSQLSLIFMMLRKVRKEDVVYINTVLPFGAALLGRIKRCRVIYHVHETSVKPRILKRFLFGMVKWASDDVVYVSQYLSAQEKFRGKKSHLLYNALPDEFFRIAMDGRKTSRKPSNVLMVCSLKDYKGVREFVLLAGDHPGYSFRLVVNASEQDILQYFAEASVPSNLEIFPTQTDLHPFYAWADLVVNLSRPDSWIETFGLTVIEGMAYALPAIVPPVGGITELVDDGVNGFQVDSRNRDQLNARLREIFETEGLHSLMSKNAAAMVSGFSEAAFIGNSLRILAQD